MKNIKFTLLALLLFGVTTGFGQVKAHLQDLKTERTTPLTLEDMRIQNFAPAIPAGQNPFFQLNSRQFQSLQPLVKPVDGQPHLKIQADADTGLPYVIQGRVKNLPQGDFQTRTAAYLDIVRESLQIDNPDDEFFIKKISAETNNQQVHYRLEQQYMGIPVYGSEVLLHEENGEFYLFNGRYYPTPVLADLTPAISEAAAQQTAVQHLSAKVTFKNLSETEKSLVNGEQITAQLVVYHLNNDPKKEHLAWHFTIIPNVTGRWSYFVDAHSGEILHQFSHICQFGGELHKHTSCSHSHSSDSETITNSTHNLPPDGPAIANATDLFGITRTINTYQVGNAYYMLDGSRSMFNGAKSNLPDEPVGSIWTINAQNTSPANNNFNVVHVSSSNNGWNNPKAISAHYNGGEAYEYFLNTFNRNSINGQGGNIISIINVADENGGNMDNAFWNGAAMFYGNGNQAFTSPLSKALDVAGHEMSHGVIQTTANLEYQGESGALNESFADIFGAMIDRNDWKLGEDIVNTNIFTTGALRDLQNPNNGGNSLNDAGYQPDHVDDQFMGSQDNGGVHINSGITNKAYYLFATAIGKDKAEQIYYRALVNYLVKSSRFVDLRIAVIQAATDLHGANSAEVNAAKDALSAVGIGEGSGTPTQVDVGENEGEEFILLSDSGLEQLYIFTPGADAVFNPLTSIGLISKPSITDDGSTIVYVDDAKNIQRITIDWNTSSVNQQALTTGGIWRNVAISKDGTKLAALTDDFDEKVLVFDLVNGDGYPEEFDLYTPTTATDGQQAEQVQYADILEFDFTGEWIMYDAFNKIESSFGNDIEYWDIGFMRVYENTTNSFDDGFIIKLFSGLPENTNVANPTFSKNSDYIIALDYVDEFNNEYSILGVNTETGDVGTIYNHTQLGYPNYSVSDEQIVFDDENGIFDPPLLSIINLQNNKIQGAGNPTPYIDNGQWGIWFANGERVLTDSKEILLGSDPIAIYPNPVTDNLTITLPSQVAGEVLLEVFDMVGKSVFSKKINLTIGDNVENIDVNELNSGTYFLKITRDDDYQTVKMTKF